MTPLVLFLMIVAAVTASARTARHGPVTDKEKIADALRAGPTFITKGATLLDWPATPTGDYGVLHKGTSEWSCLPGFPDYPHDEPGCFDRVFLQWIKDRLAGRPPTSIRLESPTCTLELGYRIRRLQPNLQTSTSTWVPIS